MTLVVILIAYVALVGMAILRVRQSGTKIFYLSAFAVNTAAICWLLFLFKFLSSDEYLARGVRSWLPWSCLLLAILLIPVAIVSLARGERSPHREMTPNERKAAFEEVRRRYPAVTVTVIIAVFWMVFVGQGTLEYLRSHYWLIILGIGVSAGLGWVVVLLIKRWQRNCHLI